MKMNPNMEKEVESNRPPTMDLLDDEFDMESPSFISPTNTDKPMKKTPLSEVSKQFDRDGKGYLDETELALRRMDSQNLGYLTVHKVYSIMQSLQTEQKKSAQLLRALDRQQKESLFLKKGILGLCVFAVLLALSNIGTSFAAAKLAKEVVVSTETGDLNNIATGERVGVTSKVTDIKMYPLTDASRRRLQLTEQTLCSTIEGEKNCHVTGTMSFNDAATLHQAFCNSWNPRMLNINQGCAGGGVDKVRLTCNGRISVITDKGLSDYSPVKDPKRNFDTVFPAPKKRYYGTAWIYNPNLDTVSGLPCLQDFTLGMYCSDYNDAQECAVLIAMDENTEACWGTEYVELCGNADDFMEGEEGR